MLLNLFRAVDTDNIKNLNVLCKYATKTQIYQTYIYAVDRGKIESIEFFIKKGLILIKF